MQLYLFNKQEDDQWLAAVCVRDQEAGLTRQSEMKKGWCEILIMR